MKNLRLLSAVSSLISMIVIIISVPAGADLFDGTGFSSADQIKTRGIISNWSYVTGGLVGTIPVLWIAAAGHVPISSELPIAVVLLPEFGLGQLIQGRYLETGWLVTTTEALSLALINASYYNGGQDSSFLWPIIYLAGRSFEVFDLWIGAQKHNETVDRLSYSLAPLKNGGYILNVGYKF